MIFQSKKFKSNKKSYHAFFSRKGGKSKGIYKSLNCGPGSNDDPKNVKNNLEIIKKKINTKFLVLVHQQHSNKVIEVKQKDLKIKKVKIKIADGIFTKLDNIAIGILTADCAPVLLMDKSNKYICCIHAGWKGAFKNILKNAIVKFKKCKIKSKDIKVCIGPCIGKKSYEVKEDFYKKFMHKNNKYTKHFLFKNNKIFFNLRNFIIDKLIESKINKNNISNINLDTFSNPQLFYSYRRSGLNFEKDYGRNLSLIIKYN